VEFAKHATGKVKPLFILNKKSKKTHIYNCKNG